jgi:hypothetical protein
MKQAIQNRAAKHEHAAEAAKTPNNSLKVRLPSFVEIRCSGHSHLSETQPMMLMGPRMMCRRPLLT